MEICRAFRHRKKPEAYSLTAGVYGPAAELVAELVAEPSAAGMLAAEPAAGPSAADKQPAEEPGFAGKALLGPAEALIVLAGFH